MEVETRVRKMIVKLVLHLLFLALCIPLCVFGFKCVIKTKEFNDEKEKIHSGVIVDKQIVNAYNGLFTSHEAKYYIVIETGLKDPNPFSDDKDDTKSFSVSEKVYLDYEVGEIFDSYNY